MNSNAKRPQSLSPPVVVTTRLLLFTLIIQTAVTSTSSRSSSNSAWFRFTQLRYNASVTENAPTRTYVTPDQPKMGVHVGRDAASASPALAVTYSVGTSIYDRIRLYIGRKFGSLQGLRPYHECHTRALLTVFATVGTFKFRTLTKIALSVVIFQLLMTL